ncbi:hypothetical protein V8D89_006532 [Ganoderma adspersum]
MVDTSEDAQELRFMIQHYQEEYGPQIQQLRDENVQLKAKVAYLQQKAANLQQKVDEQSELLKQLQNTGSSEGGPSATPPDPIPVSGPSTSRLTMTPATSHDPSKLRTPPPSSAGSTHDPIVVHDGDQDLRAENSGLQNIHPLPGPVGPPKRKSSAASPERKHIPGLMFRPSTPGKDKHPLKKRKYDVFVLVPPDRKHPVKASLTSTKLDRKHAPSSPLTPMIDGPLDYSSDSSLTSLSDDDDDDSRPLSCLVDTSIARTRATSKGPSRVAQRPRSPERDLTYFDPPPPMPMELDDRCDPTYVPSRPASPVRPTSTKRTPRTNSSQKAEAWPKPLPLSSPVRSATISRKSSPTRAEAGPSTPRQPPPASPPQRRVTLHVSPPSPSPRRRMHRRTTTSRVSRASPCTPRTPRFAVHPANPALLQSTLSRKRFSELLGGNAMRMCVPLGTRHFLFPTLKQNPRLPSSAGRPGLLLRANTEPEWRGEVQTVFVGVRGTEYRYVGEYRLTRGEQLEVGEFRALGAPMRRKWANGVVNKSKFKDIRVRIRTRRQHDREATVEEVAAAVADKEDRCEVSEEEVLQAYQSGQERLFVWRMQCVGFDEAFLADLVSKI